MFNRFFLAAAVLAAFFVVSLPPLSWGQPKTIYVFVNKDVPDQALASPQLKNIYLGKKDKWNNNQNITCTTLHSGQCQETFIQQYVKKSQFQYQNYWKKQIFTGMGQPPRAFDSPDQMVDFVSRTTGAIGYSCIPPDTNKVKLLTVNP